MEYSITSKENYHETMEAIYNLMNKGESNLSESELKKLGMMAKAAEEYEDAEPGLKPVEEPTAITVCAPKPTRP